jgi:cell division protein FtsI (penicillin-binding protein 3)
LSLTDSRHQHTPTTDHRPGFIQRFFGNQLIFEPGNPNRRLYLLSVALVAVMGLFAMRLVWVQVISGGTYAERAAATRLATSTLTAERGTIYDTNSNPLAQSQDGRNLIVDQTLITDPLADAMALSPILGVPAEELTGPLTGTSRFAYVARNVTPEVATRVLELELPGIATERSQRRVYPNNELGSGVLGFVGTDGHGLGGLEMAYEETLAGTDGMRKVEVADGKLIPTGTDIVEPAVPGSSLRLTLDRDVQWAAQSAISGQVAATGAESGTAIVMEAKTGKVLAMATSPAFNPNDTSEARPEDLQNRAVVEAFEPGSTSKLITVAAALEEQKATVATEFTVPSTIKRGTNNFSDYAPHPTYQLTLAGILAKSSNTGSIMAAELVGEETFREYLLKFGMGTVTQTGLPGEAAGYVPPLNTWSDSTFPTLSFGQGFSVSALQITSVFQTIANGGVRVEPSIVEAVIDPDGREEPQTVADPQRVVSEDTAHDVLRMMEGVVTQDGTAAAVSVPGYRIAGKTGTANRIDDSCGCYRGYTSSFIGVAPADDPELIVSVILQDPKSDYRGSATGVPVFNQVMASALQMRGVQPTGSVEPLLPIYAPGSEPGGETG